MKKVRVAIIGQGRSGRDIHGKFLLSEENKLFEVAAVVDAIEERRERAAREFGCDVYEDYRSLLKRRDIDLVVNASFSHMHYEISKDLLQHGFHVLSEKPLARTFYECEDLILTAKENHVLLTAFQQTLFNPAFRNNQEIIESGKLGKIRQISLRYSGFLRRWDWQTLQAFCGGSVYNSGPHPIGQALAFLGWDKNAEVKYVKLDTVLTSGDAEDYAKIIISAPEKPVVDLEIISSDAFADDFVCKIIGTYGTLSSKHDSYRMKYFDPAREKEHAVIREPLQDENGHPKYCSEKLNFVEESGVIQGSSFDTAVKEFYDMLYDSIVLGKPLKITAEQGAEVIRMIEACHAQNPLPVKFH